VTEFVLTPQTISRLAAAVGAVAAIVAAIAVAAAAIAAATAPKADFAAGAFAVAATALVFAVAAALVWLAVDPATARRAAAGANTALRPDQPAITPEDEDIELMNRALNREVDLGWWDRSFVPPDINRQKLDAERTEIQAGLELRYNLLELATRRLYESFRKTGLKANAPELPDFMTGNLSGAITPNGLEGRFELNGRFSAGGNVAGAPEPAANAAFSLPSLSIWQLATIDVFVEKAQFFLTTRINQNECYARCSTAGTLLVMAAAICFGLAVFDHSPFFQWVFHIPPQDPPSGEINEPTSTSSGDSASQWFAFLGNTTLLGLLLGVAYFFASLTRAFLHEATILKNRRHAVRLGRMVLHMKVSSARSPEHLAEIIAALNLSELEQAFGWNLETSTAFKDINPEAMTTSLTGQLLASLQKVSETFTSAKK